MGKRAVSFPGSSAGEGSQPETPAPAPVATGQQAAMQSIAPNDAQQFVTRSELVQARKEAEEAAFRRAQSLYEKGSKGLEIRIQEKLAAFHNSIKAAGMQYTPEQIETFENNIIKQELRAAPSALPETPPQSPAPGRGSETNPPQEEPGDPVAKAMNARADAFLDALGLEDITPQDPEWSLFNGITDPEKWWDGFKKAALAKVNRIGSSPSPAPVPQAPPRSPTNLGGVGSPVGLEASYKQELAQIPRGNVAAVTELKSKYRKLGLPVW